MMAKQVDARAFAVVLSMGCAIIGVAHILSHLLATPLAPQFLGMNASFVSAITYGIAATIPMVVLLRMFMRSTYPPFVHFRDDQIDFLSQLDFKLTHSRIVVISLVAGFGEEMLFRGVFQTYLNDHVSLSLAILVPNIVFGLLHARNIAYALIAGAAGIYFGVLYALTGALLVPIIAHALYDFAALEVARKSTKATNQS